MKKILFVMLFYIIPIMLFANDTCHVETDIFQRTVNFLIFIAIIYYLLADKTKDFFNKRSSSIQAELDKVQQVLKESNVKVENAKLELENAKKLANEIIETANVDVESIKTSIEENLQQEINNIYKSFDEKIKIETKKVKKEVIKEILDELLDSKNIDVSQKDLTNIILKKVA
jgi:F-type H+-transporting ATPase subunit b